jgi:gas vesicle protein
MAKNNNTSKWAVGALVAGVVGYAAGILTAPKSGKETREDIKHAASKARAEVEKKLKEVHSQLNGALDEAKERGAKLSGQARETLDDLVGKATAAKEKVREVLSGLHDGDADDPELQKALDDAKTALKHLQNYVKSK